LFTAIEAGGLTAMALVISAHATMARSTLSARTLDARSPASFGGSSRSLSTGRKYAAPTCTNASRAGA
jgi:hypothetical protein